MQELARLRAQVNPREIKSCGFGAQIFATVSAVHAMTNNARFQVSSKQALELRLQVSCIWRRALAPDNLIVRLMREGRRWALSDSPAKCERLSFPPLPSCKCIVPLYTLLFSRAT